jgi:xylulokinase
VLLGIDIGTSSSKGVAVSESGEIVAIETRPHATSTPAPGWFEHDPDGVWWDDTCDLSRRLLAATEHATVGAVCVSGIGPCALVTDDRNRPLRPGILYGIDTRAEAEIAEIAREIDEASLREHAGNLLTTQSVGPKLRWIARHDPDAWDEARRLFSASSFIVERLTGEYVMDHYTASASDPLYDLPTHDWWERGWGATAARLEPPRLVWPGEIVGTVTPPAAAATGLPVGTPVLAGTIDAMADSYSVGCRDIGDTMVMYGSTLFLIETVARRIDVPTLWSYGGRTEETYSLAAGMATSGLITNWFAELVDRSIQDLVDEARGVTAGSGGLVLLPYFSGERTPLFDPQARGVWIGLTLSHDRANLYRSILEGVAFGVRHNLEAMTAAGARPRRLVAVGGGTRGDLWMQIVSDVAGLPQDVPEITVGAAYGDARMAADACSFSTAAWNPVATTIVPDPRTRDVYDALYDVYTRAYPLLRDDMHHLATLHRLATLH